MIPFDKNNPYPLLPLDSYSYQEAQEHSACVDQWLGFNIAHVEKSLRSLNAEVSQNQQNWDHLSEQAFQTPYAELHNILELLQLKAQDHIVDLGCAYGRMGLVVGEHYPLVQFSGFELEPLRVKEGQRILGQHDLPLVKLYTQDLLAPDFHIPNATIYFMFDYGTAEAVKKTLHDLQEKARLQQIKVVARGKLVRFWIHEEHPWLGEVNTPQHFPHFSIYSS